MLTKNIVLFLLIANFSLCFSATTRVYFARCGFNGFTCTTIPVKNTLAVTYTCTAGDITLYINQFSSPNNIETLRIQQCTNLTISFRCNTEPKYIDAITIKNITLLKIQPDQFTSNVPTEVHFENIGYLEEIPSDTFVQIDKTTYSHSCILPKKDFRKITFKNVTIDTVRPKSFHVSRNFANFSFENVKINRIQASAIFAKLDKVSDFLVEHSEIDVVEHLAFQVTARSIYFRNNKFIDIAASGINGTTTNFTFKNNFVNTLQPHSISMLCTNVHILENKIEYLKSGALEKISPGLLEDSGRNFGTLKFIYEFKNNTLKYMDAGCLYPDYEAYNNVANKLIIQGNTLFCQCINIGWLFPGLGHGHNTQTIRSFYEIFLNYDNNNICSSSCDLPLSEADQLFKGGKCLHDDDTVDYICEEKHKPPTTAPPFPTKSVTLFKQIKATSSWIPLFNGSSIIICSTMLILLSMLTILIMV